MRTVTFTIRGASREAEKAFAKAIDRHVEEAFADHPDVGYSVLDEYEEGASNKPVERADSA